MGGTKSRERGKSAEREISKRLECTRTWWAPQDFGGGGNPDDPQPADRIYCGECKSRSVLPKWLKDAVRQAEGNAAIRAGMPVTVLHEHNQEWKDAMVVVSLKWWVAVVHPLLLKDRALVQYKTVDPEPPVD
jgi:hypothetical protein